MKKVISLELMEDTLIYFPINALSLIITKHVGNHSLGISFLSSA
jgi:hypothetical protein